MSGSSGKALYESAKVIVDPAVVEALLELVPSRSVETRATCAASLGFAQVAEDRAAGALAILVVDSEERVRKLAAKSLGLLVRRTHAAVEPLVRYALASSEEDVVRASLETLRIGGCTHPDVAMSLGLLAVRKRLVPSFWNKRAVKGWPKAWWASFIPREACQALCTFPAPLSRPLLERVLRAYVRLREASMRELAIDGILAKTPGGGEAAATILEELVRCGSVRVDDEYPDMGEEHVAHSAEFESRGYLRKLLEGPVPSEPLFRILAGARRPELRAFAPRLRELLGGVPLPSETLARIQRGLESDDPLVRSNCATLLSCVSAQGVPAEPAFVVRLGDSEEAVRASAALSLASLQDVSPEALSALTGLAQSHPQGVDGRAAREALARHGAPTPLPAGGVDARAALEQLVPLPYGSSLNAFPGEDGALYFVWDHVVKPAPADKWSTDEDEFGMGRLRFGPEGPRLDSFPLPVILPQAPTGGRTKRWLRLSTRLDGELVCALKRPFSSKEGWGDVHFLLVFSPATEKWSQLVPAEGGLKRVDIDAQLEDFERAVGGGTLLLWVDAKGQLQTRVDPTPYFIEDATPSPEVKRMYAEMKSAEDTAPREHELEVEKAGQEPWVVKAPGAAAFGPVHLYNVNLAFFDRHPSLRAEAVEAVTCQRAYRVTDAAGRRHLLLLVQARLHSGECPQAMMVFELSRVSSTGEMEGSPRP